jgi:proline iminopeptidase
LANAVDPGSSRPTSDLLADIERLRELRRIGRWLLFGGSWGVTLGLSYAETHPERVSEAIFFSITVGLCKEIDWITRDVGQFFPNAWEAFQKGVPPEHRNGDLADAYARLLADPDAKKNRSMSSRSRCGGFSLERRTAGPSICRQ